VVERARLSIPPEIGFGVLGGLASGIAGALLFAVSHAMIIVPIWGRMYSGLVFGALAGAAAGWALVEIHREYIAASTFRAAAIGARFGGTLWLLVVPVTLMDAALRATGVATRFELVAVGVAIALAVASGLVYGWVRTHRRRAAVAGATATLMLTIAMAGPVPVGRSMRALGIFLAVLPAAIVGGAIVAVVSRQSHIMWTKRCRVGARSSFSIAVVLGELLRVNC
jgi:hypothetical protein